MKLTKTVLMIALLSVVQSMTTKGCVALRKETVEIEKVFESTREDLQQAEVVTANA